MKGTLTDSGPLYALVDRDDVHHRAAVRQLDASVLPLLTTWPCITEATYLLGKVLGWKGQRALLRMVEQGDVVILGSEHHPVRAVAASMEEYADAPMDLADASLVAAAASIGVSEVFSFDGHFNAYRAGGRRFRVVPPSPD